MNFCKSCKKIIYKRDETPIFKEFGYCEKCSKNITDTFTEQDKEILYNENEYNKWKQKSYFTIKKLYSKLIEFGYSTEEELNSQIPNWRELEEKEKQEREEYYIKMKKYWSYKDIEKCKQRNQKEYDYYNKKLT